MDHRILHWQSFIELQSQIFNLKCENKCINQSGVNWIPYDKHPLNSGYSIVYRLQYTECGKKIRDFHTSPRVRVDADEDNKVSVSSSKHQYKLEKNSDFNMYIDEYYTCSIRAQNTFFDTMSCVLGLHIRYQWNKNQKGCSFYYFRVYQNSQYRRHMRSNKTGSDA